MTRPIGSKWYAATLATLVAVAAPLPGSAQQAAPPPFRSPEFIYGAAVYPEVQSPAEVTRMLDYFQTLGVNTLRVGESAWGTMEPREGRYEFGWLRAFLDEMHRRKMKAILGNGSYIAPQWLIAKHPDMRAEWFRGRPVNPMTRKAASIHHPAYRAAVIRFTRAMGSAFKNHPAVIGWQLDNEIDSLVRVANSGPQTGGALVLQDANKIDLGPAAERAFGDWLRREYRTPDELNRRWGLAAWGLKIADFSDVKLPSDGLEGPAPVVDFAYRRFLRDSIASFLAEGAQALRDGGVRDWITSDFMPRSRIASEPAITRLLSVQGINPYPGSTIGADEWSDFARDYDTMRSASPDRTFLVTETRANRLGGTEIWDSVTSPAQANLIFALPIAYGANGLLYWSGNRLASGHWPHWGALLDLNGDPEVDTPTIRTDAAFVGKWGSTLLTHPVDAKAAVLTDFDQVMAHSIYKHTSGNAAESGTTAAFEAFHRLGIGVDSLSTAGAGDAAILARYEVIVIASATVLDEKPVNAALMRFAARGGTVIVLPLTAYQTADGVFRRDRAAKGLAELTGTEIRTERLNGPGPATGGSVTFGGVPYAVGGEGYTEIVEPTGGRGMETLARFASPDPYLSGRPAIVRRSAGRGTVVKLAFWPERSQLAGLIAALSPLTNPVFEGVLDPSVHGVPRADGSMFVMNTAGSAKDLRLTRDRTDRIGGRTLRKGRITLSPYEWLWLE